jgi:hypothetical protein
MASAEAKSNAKQLVDQFEGSDAAGVFPSITRPALAAGLRDRIDHPEHMQQANTGLCGPASFLNAIADNDPVTYAHFGIDLYTKGTAKIKDLTITPSTTFKSTDPGPSGTDAADWVTLGSIRDSDNAIFTHKGVGGWWDDLKAINMPHSVADWFRKAGFTDVKNETNLIATKGWSDVREATKLRGKGYKVCLFINGDMLKVDDQENFSVLPDHWVGLASAITTTTILEDPACKIQMTVFSWGQQQTVPQKPDVKSMHPKVFLRNFYGYVAGKPA